MGGRAAESIFFGEEKVHTGAYSDMQQAYNIAKSIGTIPNYFSGGGGSTSLKTFGKYLKPVI